jgi:hypothetical protein
MVGQKSRNLFIMSSLAAALVVSAMPAQAMPAPAVATSVQMSAHDGSSLLHDVRYRRHRGRDAAIAAGAVGLMGGILLGSTMANSAPAYYDPPPPRYYAPPPSVVYYREVPPPPPRRVYVERRYYEEAPRYDYYDRY